MTTYAGIYEGMHYQSTRPNLYRVQYTAYIGQRMLDVDKVMSGFDATDVRGRLSRVDVRGGIEVTQVAQLAKEKRA